MLLRITLWALLIGSVVMGFFGIQTGSALTTIIGFVVLVFAGFLLFFLAQLSFDILIALIKYVFLAAVIVSVVLLSVKGCTLLYQKSKNVAVQTTHMIRDGSEEQKSQEQLEKEREKAKTEGIFDSGEMGFWAKIKSMDWLPSFLKSDPEAQPRPELILEGRKAEDDIDLKTLNPNNPQKIVGFPTEVRSGYLFVLNGRYVKLYGIDTPDPRQICLDNRGQEYKCGHRSKQMLKKMIYQRLLECTVVGGDHVGNYIATCSLKGNDVGAALVAVGWAVADRSVTDVYIPYETNARQNRLGLWEGKFEAPWDFRQKNKNQIYTSSN